MQDFQMIHCSNCGQENPETDLFCRKCGRNLRPAPVLQEQKRDFDKAPPRPYSWSTGEFKRERRPSARSTNRFNIRPEEHHPFRTSELPAVSGRQDLDAGFRCPHCGTTTLPIVTKRVSSTGWIVFTLLLIFTLFLFWIGLLIQEEVRVCSVCNREVG